MLHACRCIGHRREAFLEWYDEQPEELRERVNHPVSLWGKFASENKSNNPDQPHAPAHTISAKADDERMQFLAERDESWSDIIAEVLEFLKERGVELPADLRSRLDKLMAGA